MPDLLLHNARVLTMGAVPRSDALLVRGGRVHALGADAVAHAGPEVERIDAGGRTVLPGFVDPHNHLLSTAESLAALDARFPAVAELDDLVELVAAAAAVTPPGQWIRAFGMDDAKFADSRPTRQRLDDATTEHPVIIYHVSGHHAVVNSAALAWRGIGADVADPAGGRFVRDEAGRLTGMVLDAAMQHLLPVAVEIGCHGPNFHTDLPFEQLAGWLRDAGRQYLAAGLTTVADPQVSARELRVYRAAHAGGWLPLRTVAMPLSHQLDAMAGIGLAGPFGDDRLSLGAMKFYSDGTLIGGTAAFREPYGEHGEFTGSLYWPAEQLTELVAKAAGAGWRVAIHTQGDLAMENTLQAIEAGSRAYGDDFRPRIEHCGYPTQAQVGRFGGLGVIPVNQPNFLRDSGDDFLRRLGRRAHRLQPIREELDAGLRPVLSSDSFVSSLRPMDTIANAITRRTFAGAEIGADQAMTLQEALRAHTIDAAYALGMEDRIGSLEPGKLADVVVLDADVESTPTSELADVSTWLTVLDGAVVHRA
ncbi:amidohydrolase [Pseudonocardia sp. TRM90224]|uniref:amidohydrolase n=1 Tax=Pseudonocardia sp. TRM90224 TaxID=2812678 RepID=UPI001E403E36|nr:amidohydrolase [Pseudonocardia sp. TRM90224]